MFAKSSMQKEFQRKLLHFENSLAETFKILPLKVGELFSLIPQL